MFIEGEDECDDCTEEIGDEYDAPRPHRQIAVTAANQQEAKKSDWSNRGYDDDYDDDDSLDTCDIWFMICITCYVIDIWYIYMIYI